MGSWLASNSIDYNAHNPPPQSGLPDAIAFIPTATFDADVGWVIVWIDQPQATVAAALDFAPLMGGKDHGTNHPSRMLTSLA